MKKDGIQTRNRKVSSKSKNKNKCVKQEPKLGDDSRMGLSSSSPLMNQTSVISSSILSPMVGPNGHTTAFTRPSMPGLPSIHHSLYSPVVPASSSSSSYSPSISLNSSWTLINHLEIYTNEHTVPPQYKMEFHVKQNKINSTKKDVQNCFVWQTCYGPWKRWKKTVLCGCFTPTCKALLIVWASKKRWWVDSSWRC